MIKNKQNYCSPSFSSPFIIYNSLCTMAMSQASCFGIVWLVRAVCVVIYVKVFPKPSLEQTSPSLSSYCCLEMILNNWINLLNFSGQYIPQNAGASNMCFSVQGLATACRAWIPFQAFLAPTVLSNCWGHSWKGFRWCVSPETHHP